MARMVPTSDRLLDHIFIFLYSTLAIGLPEVVYLDNGKDIGAPILAAPDKIKN